MNVEITTTVNIWENCKNTQFLGSEFSISVIFCRLPPILCVCGGGGDWPGLIFSSALISRTLG
jgi:hypothetical protein